MPVFAWSIDFSAEYPKLFAFLSCALVPVIIVAISNASLMTVALLSWGKRSLESLLVGSARSRHFLLPVFLTRLILRAVIKD